MKPTPTEIAEQIVEPRMGHSLPVGGQFPDNTLDDFVTAYEIARSRFIEAVNKWESDHGIIFDPLDLEQLYLTSEKGNWERVVDAYLGRIDCKDDVATGIQATQDQAKAAFRDCFAHLETKPAETQRMVEELQTPFRYKVASYWLRYHVELCRDEDAEDEAENNDEEEDDREEIVLTGEELERSLDPIVGFMIQDMIKRRLPLDEDIN